MYIVKDTDMISIDGWKVPPGFRSDGCTCAPDRLLGVNLRPACIWHDWARRHLVHHGKMTVQMADARLHRFLVELLSRAGKLNAMTRMIARVYWLVSKVLRSRFHATQPVPSRAWVSYLAQDFNNLGIIAARGSVDG